MNTVTLTGRLTTDPELRSTTNGSVASLRLAVQRPRKDGEDQGADYVDITVFGRQADTVAQYLAKGRKVADRRTAAPLRMGLRQRPAAKARSHRPQRRVPRRPQNRGQRLQRRRPGRSRHPRRLLSDQKVWRDARANERPATRPPHPDTEEQPMRQPLSTNPVGIPHRCPTQRIRVRLPLATIEEIDYLAALHHVTRQQILRQILAAGLISDTPLRPPGPASAERLHTHAQLTHARSIELALVTESRP